MKTFFIILFTLLVVNIGHSQSKISDALAGDIQKARNNGTTVEALIMLTSQFNIDSLDLLLTQQKATVHERGVAVVTALMEHAKHTQAKLVSYLESRKSADLIRFQPFWIINTILVEASPDALLEIALQPDVAQLDQVESITLIKPVAIQPSFKKPGYSEPGLRAINAQKMWQLGFTGEGVIVGIVDVGAEGLHPAISGNWHGKSVPASQAWYDPGSGTTFPTDTDGHGTHVTGIVAGLDPVTHDTIGVAFGSEWISGRCQEGGFTTWVTNLQWMLNPDGNVSTTDDMPAVINNSWGSYPGSCNSIVLPVIKNLEAAGVAVIFAAGNSGAEPYSLCEPALSNSTGLQVFSVGAVDGNKQALPIAPFSSRGPTICIQGGDQIKPEVTAPGVMVRSSYLGGSYALLAGTSMATPHVSGAIALLKQAFPNKTGTELKQMLYETARDLGEPGEDNTYGKGIIDVYQAYIENAFPDNPRPPSQVKAYSDYTIPNEITLSWTDPTTLVSGDTLDNSEIFIFRDTTKVASIPAGIGQFADTALTDGQKYEYFVRTNYITTGNVSIERKTSAWAGGSPVPGSPKNLAGNYVSPSINLSWSDPSIQSDGTPIDDLAMIYIYRDKMLLDSIAPGVETYTDNNLPINEQTFSYSLVAADNEIPANCSKPTFEFDVFAGIKPDVLVYYGKVYGPALDYVDSVYRAIRFFRIPVFKTNDLGKFGTPIQYDAIFVITGMDNDYSHTLNSQDGFMLWSYLNNGGNLYVEGHMCFNLAPEYGNAYNIRPWLGLALGNWTADPLTHLSGLNEMSGLNFQYPELGQTWDILSPSTSTSTLWQDPGNGNIYGVYNEYNTGKIIGVVPAFGGLADTAHPEYKNYLMCRYLKMLGINTDCSVGVEENLARSKYLNMVHIIPNPFTSSTILTYNLSESSQVTLRIFDNFGRVVAEPVNGFQQKGEQKVVWTVEGLPAGVYYCRLEAGEQVVSSKIVKMK